MYHLLSNATLEVSCTSQKMIYYMILAPWVIKTATLTIGFLKQRLLLGYISFPTGQGIFWPFPFKTIGFILVGFKNILKNSFDEWNGWPLPKNWFHYHPVMKYSTNSLCWWVLMTPFQDGISFSSGHEIFCHFPLMGIDYTFSINGRILVYSWNNLFILFLDGIW